MKRSDAWPALAALASTQHGLVTSAHAAELGLSRPQVGRLVDAGYLGRVERGLYLLAGRIPGEWFEQRVAWVQLAPTLTVAQRLQGNDPVGVFSHESAAWLLGLGTVAAWRHEITISAGSRVVERKDCVVHESADPITRDEWWLREGLPVTRPEVTVRDLAASGIDGDHLATVVRDALVKYADHPGTYERILDPYAAAYFCSDGADFLRECVVTAGVSPVSAYLGRIVAA